MTTTTSTTTHHTRESYLTVAEVCATLDIARSTFYDWRAARKAPPSIRLPNGALRIPVSEFEAWLDGHREPA